MAESRALNLTFINEAIAYSEKNNRWNAVRGIVEQSIPKDTPTKFVSEKNILSITAKFSAAVCNKDLELAKLIHATQLVNINHIQDNLYFADIATKNNDAAMLAFLLENKFPITTEAVDEENKISALFVARKNKSLACIEAIAKYTRVTTANSYSYTQALNFALNENATNAVDALLQAGANVDTTTVDTTTSRGVSTTYLHHFAENDDVINIRKFLQYGASPTILSSSGETPFETAFSSKSYRAAEELLTNQKCAHINRHKLVAHLHKALAAKLHRFAALFITSGASVNTRDKISRNTALHIIATTPAFTHFEVITDPDFSVENASKNTPFQLAIKAENFAFLEWMYAQHRNKVDTTELFLLAVSSNRLELVKRMLTDDKKLCEPLNEQGNISLLVAARSDSEAMLKLLQENGADPYKHIKNGTSFLGHMHALVKAPVSLTLLNELEEKRISILTKRINHNFSMLNNNHLSHDKLADGMYLVQKDNIELLSIISVRLQRKINADITAKSDEKSAPALTHDNEQKLLAFFGAILSEKIAINTLKGYKQQLTKIPLPEVNYLLDYIARMENISSFLHRVKELNNQFLSEIATIPWKKNMLGMWVNKQPEHIETISNEVSKIQARYNSCNKFDMFAAGPAIEEFNYILSELNTATTTASSNRHPTTSNFYKQQLTKYQQVVFCDLNEKLAEEEEDVLPLPAFAAPSAPPPSAFNLNPFVAVGMPVLTNSQVDINTEALSSETTLYPRLATQLNVPTKEAYPTYLGYTGTTTTTSTTSPAHIDRILEQGANSDLDEFRSTTSSAISGPLISFDETDLASTTTTSSFTVPANQLLEPFQEIYEGVSEGKEPEQVINELFEEENFEDDNKDVEEAKESIPSTSPLRENAVFRPSVNRSNAGANTNQKRPATPLFN